MTIAQRRVKLAVAHIAARAIDKLLSVNQTGAGMQIGPEMKGEVLKSSDRNRIRRLIGSKGQESVEERAHRKALEARIRALPKAHAEVAHQIGGSLWSHITGMASAIPWGKAASALATLGSSIKSAGAAAVDKLGSAASNLFGKSPAFADYAQKASDLMGDALNSQAVKGARDTAAGALGSLAQGAVNYGAPTGVVKGLTQAAVKTASSPLTKASVVGGVGASAVKRAFSNVLA